ncbi:MAG: branched-chain amino acid ABC transporter permease [Ilumatobacteraceae bacterium]
MTPEVVSDPVSRVRRPPVYGRHQFLGVAGFIVFASILATVLDSAYNYGLLSSWLTMSILGLGFYLVFGLGGQFAFSQAAFFGLGAYSSAWASRSTSFGWGLLAAIVIGAAVALLFSLLVFRTNQFYFAITTLAFSQIALVVFREFDAFTGSGGEVIGIRKPDAFGYQFNTDVRIVWLLIGAVGVALFLVAMIERSPLRREALAVHAQPTVAATLGMPTGRLRLLMFVLGSSFAAVAGSLQAHRSGFISTEGFSVALAIDIFLILLLGGVSSMWGPIVGAAFVVVAPEKLRFIGNYRGMVYGILLILVIVVFPKGLVGLFETGWNRIRRRQSTDPEILGDSSAPDPSLEVGR